MFKILVLIFVKKIYKMQHLEGRGMPVLYKKRRVPKRLKTGSHEALFLRLTQKAVILCVRW
jgi:hypothetical protein